MLAQGLRLRVPLEAFYTSLEECPDDDALPDGIAWDAEVVQVSGRGARAVKVKILSTGEEIGTSAATAAGWQIDLERVTILIDCLRGRGMTRSESLLPVCGV